MAAYRRAAMLLVLLHNLQRPIRGDLHEDGLQLGLHVCDRLAARDDESDAAGNVGHLLHHLTHVLNCPAGADETAKQIGFAMTATLASLDGPSNDFS